MEKKKSKSFPLRTFLTAVLLYVAPSLLVALLAMFLSFGGSVHTPTKDDSYKISSYSVNIDVSKDRILAIKESITVEFNSDYHHGICRYIPLSSTISYYDENGNLQSKNYRNKLSNFEYLEDESSQNTNCIFSGKEDGYMFFQIGDLYNYAVAGKAYTYTFSYDYDIGDDRISSKDLFYFNIIGSDWNTTIAKLNFSVKFPTEIESQDFKFYVGKYGEDNTAGDERLSYSISGNTISGTCLNLDYAEAVTAYTEFHEGYFTVHKNYLFDILLAVLAFAVLCWMIIFYKKHRKTEPIIDVVEFSAPQGLTPAQVGYLDDGEITGNELSSLIVYWASKGYVSLKEHEKSVDITKVKDLPEDAKEHEKIFFNGLFKGENSQTINSRKLNHVDADVGYKSKNAVKEDLDDCFVSGVKNQYNWLCFSVIALFFMLFCKNCYQTFEYGRSMIFGFLLFLAFTIMMLVTKNLIKNKSKKSSGKYWCSLSVCAGILLIIMICSALLMESYCDAFGARFYLMIMPFIVLLIGPRLEFYTKQGRDYLGHINGLKNFIVVAEKERMEMLVKDSPELFYDILPYAYVLGVSDVYMEKFKEISLEQPSWYSSTDVFSAYLFSQIMVDNCRIMSNTIKSVSFSKNAVKIGKSIISSGGHCGGFSGGGHGGGGGRSW